MFEYVAIGGKTRNGTHDPYLNTYGIDFSDYPMQLPTVAYRVRPEPYTVRYGSPAAAWSMTGRIRNFQPRVLAREICDLIILGEPYFETSELVVVRLAWLDGRDPEALLASAWRFLSDPRLVPGLR